MRSALFGAALVATGIFTVFACSSGGDAEVAREPNPGTNNAAGSPAENTGGTGIKVGAGGGPGIDLSETTGGSNQGTGGITDACVTESVVGEQLPIDLYMMVDKSGSMACRPDQRVGRACDSTPKEQSRWTAVSTALKGFINAPENAGLGVGVAFFPRFPKYDPGCAWLCGIDPFNGKQCFEGCGCEKVECSIFCSCKDEIRDECTASGYAIPEVPIGVLPNVASDLVTSIDAQGPFGGTPTTPALEGALTHARAHATENPDRKVAIVFATDGVPDGCSGNNIDAAAKAAEAGVTGTPSIPTYVIGIGESLDNLNAIAKAGGTEQAYLLGASTDAVADFSKALESIRGRALSCDYKIPNQSDIDYGKVNVNVTIGSAGTPKLIPQAPGKEQCAADSDGWFYDNPQAPKLISLCKKTCDDVLAQAGSKLEVVMGCKTIIVGPK